MTTINKLNDAGLELIKSFEGCSLAVYLDIAGNPTVGTGHLITDKDAPLKIFDTITQAQADNYLKQDLSAACLDVENAIYAELNDNQYGALVSLVYNCGDAPLHGTLGNRLNANDYEAAADEFLRWNHVCGEVVDGLTRRREAERRLFNTPVNT